MLHVTFYNSLFYSVSQSKNLQWVGEKVEKETSLVKAKKVIEECTDNLETLYTVKESKQSIILISKQNKTPCLSVKLVDWE